MPRPRWRRCSPWWPTVFTRCISRRSCATPRTTPWKRAHERAAAQGYWRLSGDRGGSRGRRALDAARSAASRRAAVASGERGPPAARRREGRQAPHRGVEGEGRGPGGGGRGAHLRRPSADARGQEFLSSVAELIRENHLTAEKAFEFKALEMRDTWMATGSPRLKDRLADFTGVAVRVIEHLMHRGADELWEGITQPSVVVARELGPGLTVQLDREHVTGLVSEEGTRTSHAAILAHSIGIPAVFGVAGALERIGPSTMVVMDGTRGTVLLHPTPSAIAEARAREQRRRALAAQLEEVADQPAVTTDGVRILLSGNVDLRDEIREAKPPRPERAGLTRNASPSSDSLTNSSRG